MATFKYFWKVWLRLNRLTKKTENDYVAEISSTGKTLRNEDIARLIKAEGSEYKVETLLSILNQNDRIIRTKLQEGYRVMTGNFHYSPRVSGSWIGANAKYDNAVQKTSLDMILSPEMQTALGEVGVEVLGVKGDGAYIGLVTDTVTGLIDGTITPGDDILIEGDKLKIQPDEEGLGVFFVAGDGQTYPVTRRLTHNGPKKIIVRVPALPFGEYTLRVVTRYSNGTTLLNNPRIIEYGSILCVR